MLGRRRGQADSTGGAAAAAGPPPAPAAGEVLWLDQPDAAKRVRQAPRPLRGPLRELVDDGLTVLRGAIAPERCDAVVADLDLWLRSNSERLAEVADDKGRFRLNNFHLWSEAALGLSLDPDVTALLDAAFGYPAVVYSSLIFVKGTEQDVHRDSPFFATAPEGFFFGVWFALEDIHPDAGPLRYYRGGHRVHADRSSDVASYGRSVTAACEAQGLPLAVLPPVAKGDVVVWHPDLPHGGSPIADPDRTRKSMVVHYKAGTVPLHGVEVFFGSAPAPDEEHHEHVRRGDRWVVDQGAPWLQ